MYSFFIVIGVIIFYVAFKSYASRKYMRDAVSNVPGPICIPILGALHTVYKLNPKNVFTKAEEIISKYGLAMRVWAFNRLVILSMDTELNDQLLVSNVHITKNRNYGILHQWLGVGLLMSDGRKWHSRRRIITPAFHFKILEGFLEVFDRQSSVLLNCLAERTTDDKSAFDIYPYMCLVTLDIIAETAMGTKVNAQTDKTLAYTKAVKEMTTLMAWRFLRIHLNSEIVFTLLYPYKKLQQMKLIRIMHKFTRNVIAQRRCELQNKLKTEAGTGDDHSGIGAKKRMALLDVLLQATIDDKPLTDEDIREEVDTFMFAGHDTTTSALSFTLHLLSRHPQIQNKLLAEIQRVYPAGNSPKFTLMNLNELKYMECVIKESLRLYPPVPAIARDIIEDFKYEHSKLGAGVIPAGAEFLIYLYGMMRDPRRFENPNEFRPERYVQIDGGSNSSFASFSAGPRNCIGQKFAMYEMKVILVKIAQHYELLPLGAAVEPVLNIVMRSQNGMQLGIRKRNSSVN